MKKECRHARHRYRLQQLHVEKINNMFSSTSNSNYEMNSCTFTKSTYHGSWGQPTAGVMGSTVTTKGSVEWGEPTIGAGGGVYKSQDLGSTYIAADENYLTKKLGSTYKEGAREYLSQGS
jgi:hypothetical protein